jgi:hypothetical protein
MTEASIIEPGISLSEPVAIGIRDAICNASIVERRRLPVAQPSQLWLVEMLPGEAQSAPLEYHALTAANVVFYDRALAATVARLLPLGGYAEPAPERNAAGESALERCVGFVRDGWSVAWLAYPGVAGVGGRADKFRRISERLLALDMPAALSASVFTGVGGGAYERCRARLDELARGVDARRFDGCGAVTIVFDAVEAGAGPRFPIASANGLAG